MVVVQIEPHALQLGEEIRDVGQEALADVVKSCVEDRGAVVRAKSAAQTFVVLGAVGVVEDEENFGVGDERGFGVDFLAGAEDLQGEDVGGVVAGAVYAVADGVVEGAVCGWEFECGGSFDEGWMSLGASWAG